MTDTNSNITENNAPLPEITLSDLSSQMMDAVKRAGWAQLTPVQSKAIPYIQAKKDMMVQAQTGSGKTGAFLLPILERINVDKKVCQALILVPTRELAQQVAADAAVLSGDTGVRSIAVYGGTGYTPQLNAFKQGTHLVIGTPGRILDHLIKRNLTLNKLDTLVFDEADRMMSMGFLQDMLQIKDYLPDKPINSLMFSATFPPQILRAAKRFLDQPEFLSLSRDHIHVEDTKHLYYLAPGMDKDRSLVRIIEMENPNQTIIFCNTKDRVYYVARVLQRFGYNADQLSSDLSQKDRDKVLKRVREGKLRFLVATDVAARGIDIPDLSHVIQYEPPEDTELYIHRAGRTGRAGASGVAIMLININEKSQLTRIAARYNIDFEEMPLPQDEDVQAIVAQRLIGQLEAGLRNRDRLQIERMQRFIPLVQQLADEEDGVALLAMLLDDTYHDWMHHPVELSPIGSLKSPKKSKRKPRNYIRGRRNRKPDKQ